MEDISFNRLNIQAAASASIHPTPGLPWPPLKNITVNTSSNSPCSPATALGWAYVGQNIYSSSLSALLRETFPEQPLQQVHTANEDNFERWLDGIPLNS